MKIIGQALKLTGPVANCFRASGSGLTGRSFPTWFFHQKRPAHTKVKPVLVYAGEGTTSTSVREVKASLRERVDHPVELIYPGEIVQGKWKENCAALVLGGGKASEFARALGDKGIQHIRDYVTIHGGTYFGICAGAYFACHTVDFNRGGEHEMNKQHGLAFFQGTCEGPISRPYEPPTEKGAEIMQISFDRGPMNYVNGGPGTVDVYVNGGGIFLEHPPKYRRDPPRHVTLAYFRYLEHQPAAIVKCHVGTNGGVAILSSPHLERFASLEDDVMRQMCWSMVLKQGKLQTKETVYYLPSESFCFFERFAS